ncbi:DUF5802 family protein [Halosegnis marinus]|uniref:DUF5802 family protein n=1 Tax=Halosegnis marinus TaxID=3034023 RepID=A0ABD5ZL50_9EURY|nr:DUF5802 family protein [Halosegnis sp. DT85]
MFEQFSSGYYLGRLYVEPTDGDRVVMCRDDHETVNEQLYADGEGVERLDYPLVMKVGTAHLPVHGAEGVPERTLAVPEATLDAAGIRNPPTLSEVLLAKEEVASRFVGFGAASG